MKYKVNIIETLVREIEIEAESEKQAIELVELDYKDQNIILDSEDLQSLEIKVDDSYFLETPLLEYNRLIKATRENDTCYLMIQYGSLELSNKRLKELEKEINS